MAYSYVGSGSAGNAASGTALSVAATFTGGEHVFVKTTRSGASTETITDGTNTYSLIAGSQVTDVAGDVQSIYECQSVAAGSVTIIQMLGTAQTFRGIQWISYSGLMGGAAALGNLQVAPGGGTDAATSGTFTPSGQPALLLGWIYDFDTFGLAIAAGTGFTSRDTYPDESLANGGSSMAADKRLTSTSSVAATFTVGSGGGDTMITYAIFCLESTGGGTNSDDDQIITT